MNATTIKRLKNKLLRDLYHPGKSRLTDIKNLDSAIEGNLNALMGKRKKTAKKSVPPKKTLITPKKHAAKDEKGSEASGEGALQDS